MLWLLIKNKTYIDWIVYATKNNYERVILRMIDQDGFDTLFNNNLNPEININNIRFYGSKNGKYSWILKQLIFKLNIFYFTCMKQKS